MPKGVYKKSEEHKRKLSIVQKLNPSKGFLGKHHTQKVKDEQSQRISGKPSLKRGIKLSQEIKRKISINHANVSGKNNPSYKEKIKKICLVCGNEFEDIPSHKNRKFCSRKCYGIYKSKNFIGKTHPNWQGGISFEPYCEKFNEKKREEIRNQYGRKCVICGRDEKDNITKTGKQWKLSVHHIDSDKEQGCDGKQWKLAPLCMYCHNSKRMEIL